MSNLDYEAISKAAREKAKREAERMYPPDMPTQRRKYEDEEYLRIYRDMTTPPESKSLMKWFGYGLQDPS